ncbi:MAG: S-adenosylmethionine:tRNA ribosyltransferase-isomerase, partial [Candidatus Eremiobacteraeota bacterium]|nr:S-adenosylmethionine:tRNA ribosyltransferase-isomerase [Candidatus Eremiobacteraeota bacterium]
MPPDEHLSSAYHFDLPPELIAQSHAHPRDASRLLVVRADSNEHATFGVLPKYLRPGDLLVLNETKVIAARILGARHGSGGRVEVLLLRPAAQQRYDGTAVTWLALVRPGRKLRDGQQIDFGTYGNAIVRSVHDDGIRELEFDLSLPFETFLSEAGRLPLPPYITNESAQAQEDYQTIFARTPGSVAAPTASLHFTEQVMTGLSERGIEIAKLSLEVGIGTFRP